MVPHVAQGLVDPLDQLSLRIKRSHLFTDGLVPPVVEFKKLTDDALRILDALLLRVLQLCLESKRVPAHRYHHRSEYPRIQQGGCDGVWHAPMLPIWGPWRHANGRLAGEIVGGLCARDLSAREEAAGPGLELLE